MQGLRPIDRVAESFSEWTGLRHSIQTHPAGHAIIHLHAPDASVAADFIILTLPVKYIADRWVVLVSREFPVMETTRSTFNQLLAELE